jgi:RNA polymerase sigma-70 factor, ECF subfamily
VSLGVDTFLPVQVTAATAVDAAGGRTNYRLMAAVRPAVARYCRARLGCDDRADGVARAVCRTVATTPPDAFDEAVLIPFVYRTAAAAVDAVDAEVAEVVAGSAGLPAQLAALPPTQREVLVLRVAVGLSLEHTAAALGATPEAVRHAQHHALQQLRAG